MEPKKEKVLRYTVIFEPQESGGYTVLVPALPGCITEGDTLEEARKNAKEAIECYLESLAKDGEPFPEDIKEKPVFEEVQVSVKSA